MTVNELIRELQKLQEQHGDEQLMWGWPEQYPVSVQIYPQHSGKVMVHFKGGVTTLFAAFIEPAAALPQPQEQVKGKGDFRRAMDLLEQGFD